MQFLPERTFEKLDDFKIIKQVMIDGSKKFCPTVDCNTIVDLPLMTSKTKCPKCKRYFCKQCGLHWHKGMNCQEAEDEIYAEWAEGKQVSRCPKCRTRIEKISGCDHMRCTICGYYYCYICGTNLSNKIH
jgi:hypothetical protein